MTTSYKLNTPIGVLQIFASQDALTSIQLVSEKQETQTEIPPEGVIKQAVQQLQQYFSRELKQFDLPLDWTGATAFRQHALQAAMQIPWGMVITYGELSKLSGNDRAARACGGALAKNPFMIVVPCHRVIGSDGSLHGFSAEGGLKVKQWLLEFEGVQFKDGRVAR